MPAKIGFAIISHSEPEQLLRLVKTLTGLYDSPPIACHHDFGKCPLSTRPFPLNVRFVHPHWNTSWGHISVTKALLSAVSLVRESDPDWYVLLSGSDYPVRQPREVLAELQDSTFDAYIDHRLIRHGYMPPGQTEQQGFRCPAYIPIALARYYYPIVWLPHPRQTSFSGIPAGQWLPRLVDPKHWSQYLVLKSDAIARTVNKRNRYLPIFAGEMWFTANRKAVGRLLDRSTEKLLRRLRHRFASDEALMQTVWCNQPDLNISPDSRRYTDWNKGGPHPKWIEEADFDSITATKAHFARKFRADSRVLDAVDRMLLKRASRVA